MKTAFGSFHEFPLKYSIVYASNKASDTKLAGILFVNSAIELSQSPSHPSRGSRLSVGAVD